MARQPHTGRRPRGDRRRRTAYVRSATDLAARDELIATLPLVWSPRVVAARLAQLAGLILYVRERRERPWLLRRGGREAGRLEILQQEMQPYLDACGIVMRTDPTPMAQVACGRCRRLARVIFRDGTVWACETCTKYGLTFTDRLTAELLCGIRVGLSGKLIRDRHTRLVHRVTELAGQVQSPMDVLALATATAVLEIPLPRANRRAMRDVGVGYHRAAREAVGTGPVWHRFAPMLLWTFVDQLLHPDSYLGRFAPQLATRHAGAVNVPR